LNCDYYASTYKNFEILYLVIVEYVVTKITTGGTGRTSGYFGVKTPSESVA
jgi:hypothetical protein